MLAVSHRMLDVVEQLIIFQADVNAKGASIL